MFRHSTKEASDLQSFIMDCYFHNLVGYTSTIGLWKSELYIGSTTNDRIHFYDNYSPDGSTFNVFQSKLNIVNI